MWQPRSKSCTFCTRVQRHPHPFGPCNVFSPILTPACLISSPFQRRIAPKRRNHCPAHWDDNSSRWLLQLRCTREHGQCAFTALYRHCAGLGCCVSVPGAGDFPRPGNAVSVRERSERRSHSVRCFALSVHPQCDGPLLVRRCVCIETHIETHMIRPHLLLRVPASRSRWYNNTNSPDPSFIYVSIGLGFHVEMTLPEAYLFAGEKIGLLTKELERWEDQISKIAARMSIVRDPFMSTPPLVCRFIQCC